MTYTGPINLRIVENQNFLFPQNEKIIITQHHKFHATDVQ